LTVRLLLFSDTQVCFSNLQESEIALQEVLASAAKYKPDAIIHAGDVKDAYSPVEVETVKFCVRMVRRIRTAGYRFIVLLGNHDRVSQSAESKNWLDVLQAAGAEIVTRPKVKIVAGAALAFLPYSGVQEDLLAAARGVAEATAGHSGPKLMVFHAEIAGSTINASGRFGKGLSSEDLKFETYDACFGGHIHAHQQIADNGWYIGSPFCQDWGEANCKKGHLLVDVTDAGVKVRQIVTKIPHWYDADFLDKFNMVPEEGAYVRSKVQVTTKRISDQLRDEEDRIRKDYGNVRIHVVPELIDDSVSEVIVRGASDAEKVEQYVASTLPEESRFQAGQAISYMVSKLTGLKEGATGSEIRFTGVEASNVLVFEKVKLKLSRLGLVLIRGINEDWPGRSNGAGKSSLLSLLPIALCGQTGKGQKSDAWACENNSAAATVRLILRDVAGRKLEIMRGRRPHYIRLLIDGEDVSSGLRGTGKKETQGLIEQVTGYDMQTLMNAVYIDQAVANGFVFGTPSGRMDLINRFQNLERFELAQKAVSEDIKKCDVSLTELASQIDALAEQIADAEADLQELTAMQVTQCAVESAKARADLDALLEDYAAVCATSQTYSDLQSSLDDLASEITQEKVAADAAKKDMHIWKDRLLQGKGLLEAGKCPTCGQDAAQVGARLVAAAEAQYALSQTSSGNHAKALETLTATKSTAQERMDRYDTRLHDLKRAIAAGKLRLTGLQKLEAEEAARNKTQEEKCKAKQTQLKLCLRFRQAALAARQSMSIERELQEYAKKAFHRSGIPLYLAIALCPLLNKAASEYSDIFTDGNLKVSFRVQDSEFVVDVINPAGSSTIDGQSVGEAAMAGLITAFSLRDAAPKTNLLVLDEPGTGLDPEGCRQFAKGLLKLKDRFETILLVTHSAYIESLLSGETIFTVRKQGGRSHLCLS
jgi:DNA repair exonuclease SbcCD ATPase subunit/DNA repair exonuclease SbcCD nuclease subunit